MVCIREVLVAAGSAGALELLSLQAASESAMAQASASLLGKKCMV